jgi:predicted nucleic acid-binding protein
VRYLADASVIRRMEHPAVAPVLAPMIEDGEVAICPVTELAVLHSAGDLADYEATADRFRLSFLWVPVPDRGWDRATEVQHKLARQGRQSVASIATLLVAVTAEHHRLTLLHYDHDFDPIAEITGQPMRWVVPAGTAD